MIIAFRRSPCSANQPPLNWTPKKQSEYKSGDAKKATMADEGWIPWSEWIVECLHYCSSLFYSLQFYYYSGTATQTTTQSEKHRESVWRRYLSWKCVYRRQETLLGPVCPTMAGGTNRPILLHLLNLSHWSQHSLSFSLLLYRRTNAPSFKKGIKVAHFSLKKSKRGAYCWFHFWLETVPFFFVLFLILSIHGHHLFFSLGLQFAFGDGPKRYTN